MLINLLLILAAIIAVILVLAAIRPAQMHVVRHAVISATPGAVFAEVNDFHRWLAWSPWEKMDPAQQRTYEGAAAGPGAVYAWNGNRQVGAGRMTLMESRPAELIRIKLEFLKPMAGLATAEFSFRPENGATAVTWSMHSTSSNFLCKLVGLFMNMDKMVGSQFEHGLSQLKAVSEGAARI